MSARIAVVHWALSPSPEPRWYRLQRNRWAVLERKGWKFDEPRIGVHGYISISMKRGDHVCIAAASKNHSFRQKHTLLLQACEAFAKGAAV